SKNPMQMAEDFILRQNYPNPFNSTTRIEYDLPRPAWVQMTIYSLTGQPVAMLVDERQSAGSHMVHFDATRLAAGIYTCRMVADGWIEQKKMLYLK
ncbi:MAG TPA: T9SS type A sorting domain-containing protein, partial [bacterium]|nr:T9SS type A sorting domain-containing protein [bacterium]